MCAAHILSSCQGWCVLPDGREKGQGGGCEPGAQRGVSAAAWSLGRRPLRSPLGNRCPVRMASVGWCFVFVLLHPLLVGYLSTLTRD